MPLTVGSLCSGYEGLGIGLAQVLDTETAWVSEVDPSACAVLDARYPGVPNIGDLTVTDWSKVEPVDVLTAGWPCQPFSTAGKRKGADDARHLWPYIADTLRVLRPRLFVGENVAGHLSLGFDRVLADLAELGFDAEWCVVRASDVGACHRRARLFVLAHPVVDHGRRGNDVPQPSGGCELRDAPRRDALAGGVQAIPRRLAPDAPDLRRQRDGDARRRGHGPADDGGAAAHAHQEGPQGPQPAPRRDLPDWRGAYGPAIHRHERALGRPAPNPVDGRGRLSPRFVEFMMMLPEGWVTDIVTNRAKALKLLGNGVVPTQAAYALRSLLASLA